ncbi:MAG: hypothetical protein RL154_53, partial [Pseudomonadota bacterium]
FKTFGCRTNIFDTQIMTNEFGKHQITQNELEANTIIINSCTVTNGADASVRQYVNKIRTKIPNTKLLFTGCGLETLGQKLLDDGKIDGLFGSSEKSRVAEFAESSEKIIELGNKDFIDSSIITEISGKTRAYIKIQEGCDFACSYCIIPTARGKSRSLTLETILEQVEVLASSGFSEFTLTGTNVGSFANLSKLITMLYNIQGVKRVRLGSIEPCQVSDELLEIMTDDKFAKQIHVALQHVSEQILAAMNRNNIFSEDKKLLEKLFSKGFAIGTDFIVGFPGETKEIWQDAISKVKDLPLTHIHPFIFSPRDGTVAAKLKNTPKGDESKLRLKELNEIVDSCNFNFRQKKQILKVLVEENQSGFDQFYNRCDIIGAKPKSWIEVINYNTLKEKNIATEFKECNE